jgi:hypothetical protein
MALALNGFEGCNIITRGIGRGGPWKSRLFWALKWHEWSECHLGQKKSRFSLPTPSNAPSTAYRAIKNRYIKVNMTRSCHQRFVSPHKTHPVQRAARHMVTYLQIQTVPPLFLDLLKLLKVSTCLAPEVGKSYSFKKLNFQKRYRNIAYCLRSLEKSKYRERCFFLIESE